ncbi:venom toxin OcyC11-like [Drosophila nasuta]|uniref:venom toxin OcyC11-like n=1 Tax=Drosophila nasuta TaxID=42062 RepID=UPI00295E4E20|nr:venom toxin OcyC11-like [Drosophila nasuta]
MQLHILYIILSCLALGCETAEFMGIYRDDKFPGKCAITAELVIDKGVTIKDPTHECRQIVCGSQSIAIFQSCGAISGLPGHCRFGGYINATEPYPHCCERSVICNQKNRTWK